MSAFVSHKPTDPPDPLGHLGDPPHVQPDAADDAPAIIEMARETASVAAHETARWTYGELRRGTDTGAQALLRHVRPHLDPLLEEPASLQGARIGVFAPPGIPWVRAVLSVWRAGGVAVLLARMHPLAELERTVKDAEVAGLVVSHGVDDMPRVRPEDLRQAIRRRFTHAAGEPVLVDDEQLARPHRGPDGGPRSTPASPSGSERGDAVPLPLLPPLSLDAPALILYTSGTTGAPKGVVITHGHLSARVGALRSAWAWTPGDRILNVLPLHHVHGIENVLLSALASGATWETLPRFDAEAVWNALARPASSAIPVSLATGDDSPLTLFMAVPTIYHRLLEAWRQADNPTRQRWSAGARRLRLMVSGSAALPQSLLEGWRQATGHTLLERYGMTEIGMALSNPYRPATARRPGHVGQPLPGVEIRRRDDDGGLLSADNPLQQSIPGELEIRGPGVFDGYWRRPEATAEAFRDGYFVTGDLAVVAPPAPASGDTATDAEGDGDDDGDGDGDGDGAEDAPPALAYRLLGRRSVDILKTGGYKVSALEIEAILLKHPHIAECAVVGLDDAEYGQRVAAVVVLAESATQGLSLDELRRWAAPLLAPYKIPTRLSILPELPRNALGKVTKKVLAQQPPESLGG